MTLHGSNGQIPEIDRNDDEGVSSNACICHRFTACECFARVRPTRLLEQELIPFG